MEQLTQQDWDDWNRPLTEEELKEVDEILAPLGSSEVARHIIAGDKWRVDRWWTKEEIRNRSMN